jgi:hypothetical protein
MMNSPPEDVGFVLARQAHAHAERHPKREPQRPALILRVARLAQVVAEVLELHVPVIRLNREHFAQKRLEPFGFALLGGNIRLEEAFVSCCLDFN